MTDTIFSSKNLKPVTGLFMDKEGAERAYAVISKLRYHRNDFNILLSDQTRARWFSNRAPSHIGDRRGSAGATRGSALGALLTLGAEITTIGFSLSLPGLALVVAGPLSTTIAGTGASSSITGGLVGALIGWGLPEEHARYYTQGIKDGGILLAVKPHSEMDAKHVEQSWNEILFDHVYC